MTTIVAVTEVRDFDTWKAGFQKFVPLQTQNGLSNPRILRFRSNPNRFVVLLDTDDVERALTFAESDQVRQNMNGIGVINIDFAVPPDAALGTLSS